MIIIQVIRQYNNVRKIRVFRLCGEDKVDITDIAGKALGARVNNHVLHWGLGGVSIEALERLIESVLSPHP
jgi:hypothetical protein